jgi:hypothetical protein
MRAAAVRRRHNDEVQCVVLYLKQAQTDMVSIFRLFYDRPKGYLRPAILVVVGKPLLGLLASLALGLLPVDEVHPPGLTLPVDEGTGSARTVQASAEVTEASRPKTNRISLAFS